MSYKGYTAQIEFDGRDNIFVGRVLGVDGIVSFHGQSITELCERFEATIDDVLCDGVDHIPNSEVSCVKNRLILKN